MFLSDLSIKRPIFAAVMMLALVTLGAFSYKRLAVDMFPDVEIPVVTIVTKFPGASPESVEREVSKRIEEAVNPIAGVKKVLSVSRESVSTVMVEFQLEVKLNDGAQEARAKIASIRGELPEGIEEPIIQKLDFAAAPIVSLAVRSDDPSVEGPHHPRGEEGQAALREHPRRRQGRPRRSPPNARSTSTSTRRASRRSAWASTR